MKSYKSFFHSWGFITAVIYCYCFYYYVELRTGFFPEEKKNIQSSLNPRPQTPNTFLRICADSRSADFCIVLVRPSIPSCSKWPVSFFDTEPNAPTTAGTTFVLDFQILLISLARCYYFLYFSVSFCNTLLSPLREQIRPL